MSKKLPEGWKKIKLENISDIKSGGTPSRSKTEYWNGGDIPWIKISDIKEKYINNSEEFITKEGLENSSTKLFSKGTILFTIFATLGEVGILNIDATTNQAIAGIQVNEEVVNKEYLYYFLRSLKETIKSNGRGVAQKNINLSILRDYEILVPPLEKQERIVSILEKAEKATQKRKESNRLLDELVKSKFNEMFGEPIKNTKGWNWSKLEELGNWKAGGTPSRRKVEYFKGKIPWLSSGELNNKYCFDSNEHITEEAISNSSAKLIEKESLLLGMYDTAALKSTINMVECTCNQAIAYSKLSSELVNTVYVYYCIQIGKEFYKRQQRGVRQKNLNLSMIKELEIIMPPIELQNQFADFVKQVDKLKLKMENSLKELENNFNSLMQKAFNGEL
ncbi:restriction endonuclease subunit S [Paraclostridium sordellii]|nr:restriction endonuclease subunit S [Paeniclostridium sordellii]